MNCKHTKQNSQKYYENNIDRYKENRDEEFNEQFIDFIGNFFSEDIISEDDIQGFLDSFEFPNEEEWITSEYESALSDCADTAYQEYKERDI